MQMHYPACFKFQIIIYIIKNIKYSKIEIVSAKADAEHYAAQQAAEANVHRVAKMTHRWLLSGHQQRRRQHRTIRQHNSFGTGTGHR